MDDITQAIINLSERVRRLEAQEIPLNSGAPIQVPHTITGAQHTHAGGAALDIVGLTAPATIGILTPSDTPGAASAILKSAADGSLGLTHYDATTGYYHNSVAIHPPAMHTPLWLGWYEVNGTHGKLSDAYNSGVEAACTIIQVVWTYYIESANDANNYWQVDLRRDDTSASLLSWDTSADTFNTKYRVVTAYNVALTVAMRGIYIQYAKAGAGANPGNIHLFPPIIQVKP